MDGRMYGRISCVSVRYEQICSDHTLLPAAYRFVQYKFYKRGTRH